MKNCLFHCCVEVSEDKLCWGEVFEVAKAGRTKVLGTSATTVLGISGVTLNQILRQRIGHSYQALVRRISGVTLNQILRRDMEDAAISVGKCISGVTLNQILRQSRSW